jgi:hypothetical protein
VLLKQDGEVVTEATWKEECDRRKDDHEEEASATFKRCVSWWRVWTQCLGSDSKISRFLQLNG